MPRPAEPFGIAAMMTLAARGVGKVDRDGRRGATLVTVDEIEAMACLLALWGLTPIQPGSYAPPDIFTHSEGERA
ncbi:MAG: hypothetical protein ACOY5U_02375 [Pseudomonadota bacterium]